MPKSLLALFSISSYLHSLKETHFNMKSFRSTKNFVLCSLVSMLSFACACQQVGGKGSTDIVKPLADDAVILEFKGGKITAKDVATSVNPKIKQLNEEAVQAYTETAQNMVLRRIIEAEAKEKNVAPEVFLQQAIGPVNVTEKDVDDIFKANPQLKKGIPDQQTGKLRKISREEVKGRLEEQARRTKQQQLIEGLMAKAELRTVLELPRLTVGLSDSMPSFGSKSSKVVVQEFSDFQCPFCEKGRRVVNQIKDAYGEKVRVVFRHYPLPPSMHPEAKGSAMASVCAHEQGKFWEYHDKLFDNQQTLSATAYVGWAKDLGLNVEKFNTCMKDSKTEKVVEADQQEGERVGVNSTPTFFVNGKKVAGALPFDQFKSMIDAELAKK